ncbi:TVP38/TMEM64 family protein [Ruminococcus flavefaciens]|uniref:TVP38/TMEM64 family protein n=1 Tax=Ruminococcus flavefaciens TaxID=1265 RepID=UPI0026F27648|nr:VTT domain-containing protein [Ruminococcus flavefaciens]
MNKITAFFKKNMKLISALTFAAILILCIINRNIFSIEYLEAHMPEQPFPAFCFIMLMYLLKTVSIAFPVKAIQITVGALYPKALAFLINLTGSILGFITAYFIGKMLGKEYVVKLADKYPRFKAVIECQSNGTVFFSIILRTMTFIPLDVASMYMGASESSFGKYLFGSIIGIIPSVAIATSMGYYLLDPFSKGFILPFSLLTLMSVVSFVCGLIYIRKHIPTDA